MTRASSRTSPISSRSTFRHGPGSAAGWLFPLTWLDTIRGITFFGHAIGNCFVEMPGYIQATRRFMSRPDYAENDFLHMAFELGAPGVLLLGGIYVYALFLANCLKVRLAALALLMESCFGFSLHMPATAD